jgi:hypothetical protein
MRSAAFRAIFMLIRITVYLDWVRELSECGAEERG